MHRYILQLTALIASLSTWVLCASAQCPDSVELNITATLYTQENGLASNMITEMTKDSIGYRYFLGVNEKWIRYDGVSFGLKQYDKYSFLHYSFEDISNETYKIEYAGNTIYKRGKDRNGIAYKCGLNADSLTWINLENNKQEAFPLPDALRRRHWLQFYPEGENCWLTTADSLYRFNIGSGKFVRIDLPVTPKDLQTANETVAVLLSYDNSSFLLHGNMLLKINDTSEALQKFADFSQKIRTAPGPEIIMDHYLFVAGITSTLYEVDLQNGSVNTIDISNYTSVKNAGALKITTLKNYKDYLLIGTSNAGLFIFNRCTHTMQSFQYEKQNADNLTNDITWLQVDNENVIWMQTEAGLIKLEVNEQQMKTYKPSSVKYNGLCNDCNNARSFYLRDKNNLLIATFGGVYNFNLDSGKFSNLISPVTNQPLWNDRPVSSVTGDGKGNIFIGGWRNEGILLLNTGKKKLVNILQLNDHPDLWYSYLHCLFFDSHHTLWAGTREGFLRITSLDDFEKNDFAGNLNISNGFTGNYKQNTGTCFTVAEDAKENIWMGTANGLYIYNYKTNSVTKYAHAVNNNKTISDNEVRSIHFSGNNDVWIGTNNGGLNHFNIATKTFTAFTTEDGLPGNSIYTILEDDKGFLWLGTNAGLCRFNKSDHSVRNYTQRDGIQNLEFNTNAALIASDGRFCFGERTGLNIFQPDSMSSNLHPAKVVITSFKIFDKEYPVPDSVLHLSHNQNSFSFDFAALNYYRSNDNQYAYMLEGADKDWIKSGNRHYTSYNNLSPGEYTFKVRAANYTGAWSNSIASVKFMINPAWYDTLWFRIAMTLLVIGIIYSLYRYRLAQVMKLQAVRNGIASDLHDEIGSTLSSISLSSTIIQSKLNGDNAEIQKLLQQVSNNTDNMMEALSDIVWAINTRNDRFDNVVNRMRAFAIQLLEPCGISIQFNVSEDVMGIQLDMQQRKNLYLIFKEAVNNAAKYAACKNVSIDISKEANKVFVLQIKDDGKGFEMVTVNREGKTLSGNGIINMRKRADELDGEIKINSVFNKGTILILRFPV